MLLWYNTAWAVLLIMYTIYNYIHTHSITDYNTLLYHGLLSIDYCSMNPATLFLLLTGLYFVDSSYPQQGIAYRNNLVETE